MLREIEKVSGESKLPFGLPLLQELGEARLEQGRRSFAEVLYYGDIRVDRHHLVACFRHACSRHASKMPQPEDGNSHFRRSSSHLFWVNHSSVCRTLSLIVYRGFQPSARTRAVSRKMKGLSPTQPRSPPV